MFTQPNIFSKIWVKYFADLDTATDTTDDSAVRDAMEGRPNGETARIEEIDRQLLFSATHRDAAREIEDLLLLQAFQREIGLSEIARLIATTGLPTPTALTIAAGEVTVSATDKWLWHTIDTEGAAAADDLTKINGGSVGAILTIQSVSAARVVTVKNGASIIAGADFVLDSPLDKLTLLCTAADTWEQWGNRSSNA